MASLARRALLLLALLLATGAPAMAGGTGDVAHDAGLQWGLDRIGAVDAWRIGRGAGITIAVIDSGVTSGHEDLVDNLLPGVGCENTGGDPARCSGPPDDDDGHGTHVAGIAAAASGNRAGIAGVAPDANLLPIKVLHSACETCPASGNAADVEAAIRWAADRGADVINLSLGSTTDTVFGPGFAAAIDHAWDAGAIPVVAAGNQLVITADFGDAPAVVVSAVTRDDTAPSYSNGVGQARWAVAAPGGESGDTATSCSQEGAPVGILSTYWAPETTDAYACLSGTSMAAPHVAGGLAILLGAGLDQEAAVATLLSTAQDIGDPGPDPLFGAGVIDLRAAAAAVETVAPTAVPPDVGPGGPSGPIDPSLTPGTAGPDTDEPVLAQPFVEPDPAEVPLALVAVAVLGILGTAVAMTELHRRDLL